MKTAPPIFLLIIFSCTQQTNPSDSKAPEQNSGEEISEGQFRADADTLTFNADSTFYIGYVNSFPITKEYYIQLYFRADEVEDYDFDELLDSTIYKAQETTRSRLPMQEAKKLFVTEGLETLYLYDSRYQRVTTARLVRVEKLDQPIESPFIAVYKGDKFITDKNGPYYGITSGSKGYEIDNFSAQLLKDKMLNQTILQKLAIDTPGLAIEHYKVLPDNCIYSLLSTDQLSYITELKGDSLTVLKFVNDDTYINGIFPLPIRVNGRPALLISGGVRESDVMWEYLAVFKDSSYINVNRNRLKILHK